ncbi:MAG: hypothetical protein QW478_12305 [Candidatus Micrarchaeaceae archaeon]
MENFVDSEKYLAHAQLELDSEGISVKILNKDLIVLTNVSNGKSVPITRKFIESHPLPPSDTGITTVYDLCKHVFEVIDKYEIFYNRKKNEGNKSI